MNFKELKLKRTKTENVGELIAFLGEEGAQFNEITRNSDTITHLKKNDDGSIQYSLIKDDVAVITFKMEAGKESEIPLPNGKSVKSVCTFGSDEIKTVLTFPSGKVLRFTRYLDPGNLRTDLSIDGCNIKGCIYYEKV